MSTPITRESLAALMYPGLNKVYVLTYASYPEEYTKFLNIESSDRRQEQDAVVAGFGLVPEKAEGGQPIYDVMKLSNLVTYTHKTYAMGFEVTEECREDELYQVVSKAPKMLALAVKQTQDVLGASVLNNAFNSDYTGVDGVCLCATSHSQLKAGGSVANTPSVTVDFDPTALQDALETWETWVDDNNLPIMIKPKYVISGPKQRSIITQTLGSQLQPFTADNEVNAVREWELEKMILHYLTDDDAWFILSRPTDHYLKWFWRVKPVFRGFDDPTTGNARFLTRFRCSYGFTHWWGVYGSPGV